MIANAFKLLIAFSNSVKNHSIHQLKSVHASFNHNEQLLRKLLFFTFILKYNRTNSILRSILRNNTILKIMRYGILYQYCSRSQIFCYVKRNSLVISNVRTLFGEQRAFEHRLFYFIQSN